MRTWAFIDLVVDHKTGKLRETSLWSNIGKAAMTWAFIYTVYAKQSSEWLWAAYGGVVVLHETASRFFNQKQQALDKQNGTTS